MANFKGGFAFNNEAAKVEVEQAPDGTLISCVNPVTGESMSAGNIKEVIEGTLEAPFGNYVVNDLAIAINSGNISGEIVVDGTSLGLTDYIHLPISANFLNGVLTGIKASSALIAANAVTLAADGYWAISTGTYYRAYLSGSVATLPGTLPTTLTIYHHPMPE